MEYKWRIKLVLSNGVEMNGVYECEYDRAQDAVGKLLNSDSYFNPQLTYRSIGNENLTGDIVFRVGDVSAIEISPL